LENRVPDPAPISRLSDNVTRDVLPSGLTLLVKENHTAPVAALLAFVQIGYFHEPDRLNGIAHVIEHMLFKGTPRRPESDQFAREVRELGGVTNAGTYYEETYYYVTVPSRHLEKAMDLHADAFQNPLFDAGELAREIEVIVQESLQKRDNPNAMLVESLYALAYDRHRIRRWRIGHPETLRALTREDLLQFYQETYRPANVTLAVVGDVDTAQVQALAQRYWGGLPRGELRRELSPAEPPREGFRYQRLTGDTNQRLLLMALPAPSILHADAAPLMVLSALLSDGRSARLYRRLKEELRVANSAWASYEGFEQMGIFTLGAESIGDDPLPVEQALWNELDRLRYEGVKEEELTRIKTRIESRRLYAQEEVLGVARTLATYEALGDYHLTDTMLDRLRAVTANDIYHVVMEYLRVPYVSLMEYLPTSPPAPSRPQEEIEKALRGAQGRSTEAHSVRIDTTGLPRLDVREHGIFVPTHTPASWQQTSDAKALSLPNGGILYYKRRADLPLVSLSVLFPGGRRQETQANCGVTNLMLKSSLKGTRSYTAEEIANRIEGLGSGIGTSLASDCFGYGMKIKKEFLREGFALFSEVLTQPTFPADEVEREKQSIYAEIRRQQDSNFSLAYDLFASACYGEQHPYGLPASGIAEAVASLTPEDLAAWHARNLTAETRVVGLVGDIEEEEAVALFAQIEGNGELRRGGEEEMVFRFPVSPSPPLLLSSPPGTERAVRREKQQTAAALGFAGANIANEDRYALDVLSEITSGMGGRFFRAVRGENALAYQVTSFHRSRLDAGNFIAYTSTAPENEQRARDLLLKEIAVLQRDFVSPEELAAAKAAIVGEHVIGTQTFGAQAGELAAVGVFGLPPDEPQRYLARVEAVTAEEVRDVARRYLQPERSWLGVVRGGAQEAKPE
jgi:zinc protease